MGARAPERAALALDILTERVAGLCAHKVPDPEPVKARTALTVVEEVLAPPGLGSANWTLARLADEIEKRTGERISKSRFSMVLRKEGAMAGAGHAIR